jgi:hypothetical protein
MGNIRDLLPFVLFAIPIIAIIGGITIGIIRVIGEHRLLELAQRERIAAIERGLDPSKLPPLPSSLYEGLSHGGRPPALRRAQGLLIGGLVTVAAGIGIMLLLRVLEPHDEHWVVGVIPLLIGLALLVSARIVWPRGNGNGHSLTPPPTA